MMSVRIDLITNEGLRFLIGDTDHKIKALMAQKKLYEDELNRRVNK